MTADERKQKLDERIRENVTRGARVESRSEFSAVLVRGRRVNHVLHLLLTLVTVGVWLIPWIVIAWKGGEQRAYVSVDEHGRVRLDEIP